MRASRGVVDLDSYAAAMTEPYVASVLHQMATRFGCDRTWSDNDPCGYTPKPIIAAPLPQNIGSTYGYGKRTGASIMVSSGARVMADGHTWTLCGDNPRLSRRGVTGTGSVELDTTVRIRLGVPKGASGDGNSFLCWADEYSLPGGMTIVRLNTHIGSLWLQSSAGSRYDSPAWRIATNDVSYVGSRVVQLQRAIMTHRVVNNALLKRGPHTGLSSRDRYGREWTVSREELVVAASLGLEVIGRYNDRLWERPNRLVLDPPYSVVWRFEDPSGPDGWLYLPFKLDRKKHD